MCQLPIINYHTNSVAEAIINLIENDCFIVQQQHRSRRWPMYKHKRYDTTEHTMKYTQCLESGNILLHTTKTKHSAMNWSRAHREERMKCHLGFAVSHFQQLGEQLDRGLRVGANQTQVKEPSRHVQSTPPHPTAE